MNDAVLRASEVSYVAGVRDANRGGFRLRLREASLRPGSRLAVCGPSGCGKSTLLGLLSLALAPHEAGRLELGGVDAALLWRQGRADRLSALRARLVGFVPQTGGLLAFLTLGDNMRLPQDILRRPDPARLARLADRLGIASILGRLPPEVSVGQRQRAAIGRALVHAPALVLADEPTAALHPAQADDVLRLFVEAADEGAAVLVATHDPHRARASGFEVVECRVDQRRETTEFDLEPGR